MNRFIATNRVLSRRIFATKNGEDSYLTVLLEVPEETRLPEQGTPPNVDTAVKGTGPKQGKPDRPMTKEEEEILAALKQCRNEMAGKLGTHVYTIATNEDLETLAMVKPETIEELSRIKGMGEQRVAKFGKYFLGVLDKHRPKGDGKNKPGTVAAAPSSEELSLGYGKPGTEEEAFKAMREAEKK